MSTLGILTNSDGPARTTSQAALSFSIEEVNNAYYLHFVAR